VARPSYCEGGTVEGCPRCEQAEADAQLAAEAHAECRAVLARGDLDGAIRAADEAERIEGAWGDSPTYGPVLALLEARQARQVALAEARQNRQARLRGR